MKKLKAADLNQEIYDLFDDYVHDRISRRDFLNKVSRFTAAGISATAILDFLTPVYAQSTTQVAEDDPRLKTTYIEYNSLKGGVKIKAQLSRPANVVDKLPGIVVVHENRGLNPHIADVGRRTALAGFLSLAPDALTPLGGYPGNDDDGRVLQRQRDRNEMLEDFIAAYDYLKNHPDCTGKVGVVGFCFGGWIANMMAVKIKNLKAAAPFYGGQPAEEDVVEIKAPLLLHFAALDNRVNEGWPAYEAALKKHNKEYKAFIYPDVNHGFHNDTTPRYDKAAATLAWQRTIDFFNNKLK